MTRPHKYKPGNREKQAERMRKMMADPVFAEARARYASRRMKAIHEAYRNARKDDDAR